MKKLLLLALVALCAFAAFGADRAGATMAQYTQKAIMVNFTVTPSPVAYTPARPPTAAVAQAAPPAERPAGASPRILPFPTTALFGAGTGWGIALPAAQTIAATQGNIPVSINVQADPKAKYLHIVPLTPNMMAAYGLNTYPCAFQVYAWYTTTWRVTDWALAGAFPDDGNLSWIAHGITASYTAFVANSPGQLTFNGVANVAQTVCIDLQLNVPSTIPAGAYSAPLQYTLVVTI